MKRRLSLSPVSAACFRPSSVRYLEQDIVEPRPDDYQSKKINYLNFSISFHLLNNMMTIGEGKYYLSILYIYIYIYFVGLFVCTFVFYKRNGRTDLAQFFYGTSHDTRKGLWKVKIEKMWIFQYPQNNPINP